MIVSLTSVYVPPGDASVPETIDVFATSVELCSNNVVPVVMCANEPQLVWFCVAYESITRIVVFASSPSITPPHALPPNDVFPVNTERSNVALAPPLMNSTPPEPVDALSLNRHSD